MGWDVAVLEFRLRRYGLRARAVDGRFTKPTAVALRRYQARRGLAADGIAGPKTYRSLAGRTAPPTVWHVVQPGESFFSIAALSIAVILTVWSLAVYLKTFRTLNLQRKAAP